MDDEMTEEEIVRFVATLKRLRERGDEGRTAVVRMGDLCAVLDGWLTATRERDEARVGRALAEELACAIGLERDILHRELANARAEIARLRAPRPSAIVLRPVEPTTEDR